MKQDDPGETNVDYFIYTSDEGWRYVPLSAGPGWHPGNDDYLGVHVPGDPDRSGFLFSSWRIER